MAGIAKQTRSRVAMTVLVAVIFSAAVCVAPESDKKGDLLLVPSVAELKQRMPHADFSEFEKDPDVNKMAELFKVQTIVNYVMGKVD